MIYTDTRDNSVKVDFKTAVMGGMNQKTGGLYIPVQFPKLNSDLLNKDPAPSFRDIAFNMAISLFLLIIIIIIAVIIVNVEKIYPTVVNIPNIDFSIAISFFISLFLSVIEVYVLLL